MTRILALNVQTEEVTKNFDVINECYKCMTHLLETLAWVQEMLVIVEIEVEITCEDDIQQVITKLQVEAFSFIQYQISKILYKD